MQILLNLTYDQKCCPFSDHTSDAHDFLVADYRSSTALLKYKSLWQFGEVHYLATGLNCHTAAHSVHQQHFWLHQSSWGAVSLNIKLKHKRNSDKKFFRLLFAYFMEQIKLLS